MNLLGWFWWQKIVCRARFFLLLFKLKTWRRYWMQTIFSMQHNGKKRNAVKELFAGPLSLSPTSVKWVASLPECCGLCASCFTPLLVTAWCVLRVFLRTAWCLSNQRMAEPLSWIQAVRLNACKVVTALSNLCWVTLLEQGWGVVKLDKGPPAALPKLSDDVILWNEM